MSGVVTMTAGTGLSPALVTYWTKGAGALKIRWDSPEGGDYGRCITEIQKAITDDGRPPLSDPVIHGLCQTLHRIATGKSAGHGTVESAGKG
jgi:hypothetical protein